MKDFKLFFLNCFFLRYKSKYVSSDLQKKKKKKKLKTPVSKTVEFHVTAVFDYLIGRLREKFCFPSLDFALTRQMR